MYRTGRPWDTKAVQTQIQRVVLYIQDNPWQSASQIAKALGLKSGVVSGCLKLMEEKRWLVRKPGCGPRGGMGYNLHPKCIPRRRPGLSWHERLLRELDLPEPEVAVLVPGAGPGGLGPGEPGNGL